MSLMTRLFGNKKNAQLSTPSFDPNSTTPVDLVLRLNPKKNRREQMIALIDAAKDAAARELPEFAYVPDPRISANGDYAVGAIIYDKKGGNVLAGVILDEVSGIVRITLQGDSRRHVGELRETLTELGYEKNIL